MHSIYLFVDESTFSLTLATFQVGKNLACFNHECLQVDRKSKHQLAKNTCLLIPRPLTYSLPSRLRVILGAQEISGLIFHFLGGLLGDFITPWDDLNSSVLVEYKYREVNRKTPLLEEKYCHSCLSPKELYTFGKWRRRFGLPSPPGCVVVFSFIYRFGPHVACVYRGFPLVDPCTS